MVSKLESLKARRARLLQNGKNFEGQGILRKLDRKIRKIENQK